MDNAKSFISIQRLNADQSIFKCAFDQIEIMEVNNSKANREDKTEYNSRLSLINLHFKNAITPKTMNKFHHQHMNQ